MRAALFAIVLASSSAYAQPAAEAKAKIAQGKALLKRKQVTEACEAFSESERIVPAASTTLLLADCREREGKLATAHALFVKAAATATGARYRRGAAEAKRRAKKLAPRLSYLTVVVPMERRVFQLALARDGVAIAEDDWGTRLAVDPGPHTLTASAPGRVTWTTTITIDTKTKQETIEMPALDAVPQAPPPPPPRPAVVEQQRGARRYKTATIGLSVLGVGGIGLGVAFGLRARSLAADADAICPNEACLVPEGLDLNQRARSSATYANVAFIGGGLALAGAAVLFWIGRPTVRPVVERDQVGFAVETTW